MTARPHERPEFYNAVTYAVTVAITVEGGKRRGTADRRARKVAERLANSAARTPGVIEVSASAGWTTKDGEVHWPERVRFAEANSGQGTHAAPDKLDRYLDPDHELALRSLAEENAAAEQRRQADRDRRRVAGCRNTHAFHGPVEQAPLSPLGRRGTSSYPSKRFGLTGWTTLCIRSKRMINKVNMPRRSVVTSARQRGWVAAMVTGAGVSGALLTSARILTRGEVEGVALHASLAQ